MFRPWRALHGRWLRCFEKLQSPDLAASSLAVSFALAATMWTTHDRRRCRCASLHCDSGGLKSSSQEALRLFFCKKTNSFTPVFEVTPIANTASTNVNGALLLDYARSMGNVGMKENVYERFYSAMLLAAQASPGRLVSTAEAAKGAVTAMRDLGFMASFARVSGSETPSMGAVGAIFIDIYECPNRPLHPKNVALIYIEGPNGMGASVNGGPLRELRLPVFEDCEDFLQAVSCMAANAMLAVREYNHVQAGKPEQLPRIDVIQFCLVSGGAYRHPEASKLDVAVAIVKGLHAGAAVCGIGVTEPLPAVRFAYDGGVFEAAVKMVNS